MARRQARSQEVAKLAGVSRTTVSFVLNDVPGVKITEETRRRVFQAAQELNYYPTAAARSLASGKTQRIGLILGEGQERTGKVSDWYTLGLVFTHARATDYYPGRRARCLFQAAGRFSIFEP